MALPAGTLVAEKTKDRPKPEGQKRAGRRPGGPGRMPDIGLADDQKSKVEDIRKKALAATKDAKGGGDKKRPDSE